MTPAERFTAANLRMSKKEYLHQYYQNNKDKISVLRKEEMQNNPEKYRERRRDYYLRNKNSILIKHKDWKKNNQEKIKLSTKKYTQMNKEKIKNQGRIYRIKNKEHIAKVSNEYRKKHWDKYLASARKRRQVVKAKIFSHYGYKCECCGDTTKEFLTIDHINGGGTKHRKETGQGLGFYYWLIRNNFPKEYRTLCMNCNFSLGKYGYCPHKNKIEGVKE